MCTTLFITQLVFLKCLRMNYQNFNKKLNVLRVSELIADIYQVYDGNIGYCFCSIDVVSMFDNIPMKKVIKVMQNLGNQISNGYVNMDTLLSLVNMDVNIFDYFKYEVKTVGMYFHKKI